MIQLQVINYILSTGDASFLLVNNLTDEYFCDYKDEFNFILRHLQQYGNIPDQLTFLAEFDSFDIVKVNEPPAFLLDQLYKDRNRRILVETFNEMRKYLNENNVEDAISLYTKTSDQLSKLTHISYTDILRDTSRYHRYLEKCKDYSKFYIKTGFNELDSLIGGWDKNEELVTLSARSGVGKSWMLLKCAVSAAEQGLNVGIYSGEMSTDKVAYRIDTLISHISNTSIVRGNSEIQNTYKQHLDSIKDKIKGSIKVMTPQDLGNIASITALQAFIDKEHLDMLCVDQHSLLEDIRKGKTPVERASNISKDLKNLQVLKKIPIIAVSQQNRAAAENGAGTEHIAQSDRIAQDSTIIIFFEQKDNILTLNLAKSRDSVSNKKLHYIVDFDKGLLTYIPENADENINAQLHSEYDEDEKDVF